MTTGIAKMADQLAAELNLERIVPKTWNECRDHCDLRTAGDLDTVPLDVLTDAVWARLKRPSRPHYAACYQCQDVLGHSLRMVRVTLDGKVVASISVTPGGEIIARQDTPPDVVQAVNVHLQSYPAPTPDAVTALLKAAK